MKLFLIASLLFLSTALMAQQLMAQRPAQLLMDAYRSRSNDGLRQFFENWAKEIPPRSADEIDRLPDTAREIYRLYQEFYDPRDLDRIGGSEWGNDI